ELLSFPTRRSSDLLQYPHTEDLALRQGLLKVVWDRAQVFPYDQRPVSPGLQCQQAQQVFQRIAQVGALACIGAVGDQPQTLQSHDVIDAQATTVAQAGPLHTTEGAVVVVAHALGRECRDAPVMTAGIEQIGRCADADPGEQLLLAGPAEAAGRVCAYGHVGYQPYAHPGFPRAVMSPGQTALGQPLAEGVELQLLGMLTGKLAHFRRPGLTP